MDNTTPLISVLITTYNRSQVLRRAICSVLRQSYKNFELIIIDDCSSDDTPDVIQSISDTRVHYIRNETNVGHALGDRAHIRRFIYELMHGEYFVYLCDDDYWASPFLLRKQMDAFLLNPNVAMVVGGQLSHYVESDSPDEINIREIPQISYHDRHKIPLPPTMFFKHLYDKSFMTSQEFLMTFASDPATRNIVAGATLYSKKHFLASGAMSTNNGSKWQAGYELSMGPACAGNVVYLDEPCVIVEVRSGNASFGGTQLEHYHDCMVSIDIAFQHPLSQDTFSWEQKQVFNQAKKEVTRNISRAFMSNTLTIKLHGKLTACGKKNMAEMVRTQHVLKYFSKNRVRPKLKDYKFFMVLSLPSKLTKKLIRSEVI